MRKALAFNYFYLISAIGLLFSLQACSPKYADFVPQTQEILSDGDLRRVQFYNSDDILLKREVSSDIAQVKGGKIIKKGNTLVETIQIKAETPGVCVKSEDNMLGVAFQADNNNFLYFKPKGNEYVLQVKNDSVDYGGKNYYVQALSTPILKVKQSQMDKLDQSNKKLKGRKVR